MKKRTGITTKIMMKFMQIPPSAKTVLFGFSIPCTPKLKTSVVSRVTTRLPLIHSRISSLLTKRPKPNILATFSILYTPDQITLHRPMPAKKLDDAVGVNMDMMNLQLTDDGDFAPMPPRDARSALLRGVGHLELQLGAFVEDNAHHVLEGLAVDESPSTTDDGSVAFGLDEAKGLACLALQVPVDEWNLTAPLPAAYGFVGFDVLPPA